MQFQKLHGMRPSDARNHTKPCVLYVEIATFDITVYLQMFKENGRRDIKTGCAQGPDFDV